MVFDVDTLGISAEIGPREIGWDAIGLLDFKVTHIQRGDESDLLAISMPAVLRQTSTVLLSGRCRRFLCRRSNPAAWF